MKARKVSGLDPEGTLADNAELIVRVRLDELCGFMPKAADPDEVVALHDMRIAAKRLRYILELTAHCFGAYAKKAAKQAKELQDLLGEIHDCDVHLPEVAGFAARLLAEDVAALHAAGADDPAKAPHAREHAGLVALQAHLRARRRMLFDRFVALWSEYERKGFRARLEYAVGERAGGATDERR